MCIKRALLRKSCRNMRRKRGLTEGIVKGKTMPTVRYTNVNGQIIAEKRGGSRSFNGADPLGSTAVLYDSSGNATDTFSYWPYGEVRNSTGSTATPFKFCGIWGYYGDATGRLYVRARFYRDKLARWQSRESTYLAESAYAYCGNSPTSFVDANGLQRQASQYSGRGAGNLS